MPKFRPRGRFNDYGDMMVNATSEQSKHKSRTFNALIYISLNFGAKIPGFNDEIEVLNKQEMVLNFLSFLT